MSSSSHQPSLARRVWPALAIAGASGAFLTSLDKPASLSFDEVALTGSAGTTATVGVTSVPVTTVPVSAVPVSAVPVSAGPVSAGPVSAVPVTTVPAPPITIVAAPVAVDSGLCDAAPIAGPTMSTRWGPVQVQATLRTDGTVCEIEALVTPNSHRRSVQINNRATPILHDRIVATGDASFQSVSGATVTSKGYRASLQAILDNA